MKAFLKEELENILNSIKYFDLYGSDPIRKSIYNIVGNSEVSKNFTTKAIASVGVLLVSIATAIGVVNDVASFPEALRNLRNEFLLPYIEEFEMSPSKLGDMSSATTEVVTESNLKSQSTTRLLAPDS